MHGRFAVASVPAMTEMNWYTDASLSSENHVFTAGSLAQCVRRWTRLHEWHQARTQIRIGGRTGYFAHGLPVLDEAEISRLASRPDLYKV